MRVTYEPYGTDNQPIGHGDIEQPSLSPRDITVPFRVWEGKAKMKVTREPKGTDSSHIKVGDMVEWWGWSSNPGRIGIVTKLLDRGVLVLWLGRGCNGLQEATSASHLQRLNSGDRVCLEQE